MQSTFGQASPRSFNPMLASKLSEEARRAVNEVFDAMSTWRTETANSSEKNGEQVIEKMAAAARARLPASRVKRRTAAQAGSRGVK